jgi:hypothetical protein
MLQYYLQNDPHLFKAACEDQLTMMKEEKEGDEKLWMQQNEEGTSEASAALSTMDIDLSKCVVTV